ncbi:hypothetical protein [Streptomyces sp. NBC_01320]|uniref:hypothetical protein n=1 Tax=Streptomyces sp. NBC_01320 TaxID=2903824 RepID=UPI002E0DD914|nr:hypothetical protein OG395_57275 [Streptomyces sp. NBC_01320]
MSDHPDMERVDCTDCFALPGPDNTRVLSARAGGMLGEVWHMPDCPQFTIMRIMGEEGCKRVLEEEVWATGVFHAARERLQQAFAALPADTAVQPFVGALTELVQAQADTTGFAMLHRWAEILDRHFPPSFPDSDRTTG